MALRCRAAGGSAFVAAPEKLAMQAACTCSLSSVAREVGADCWHVELSSTLWSTPCHLAGLDYLQNHQPETEGDWGERKLRALQGGCRCFSFMLCCAPLACLVAATVLLLPLTAQPFCRAVYYEQMPIRQANADNKQQVWDCAAYLLSSAAALSHAASLDPRIGHGVRMLTPILHAQIYRNFEIGKLIKLIMLDTRIIGRSPQNASLTAVNVRALSSLPTPHLQSLTTQSPHDIRMAAVEPCRLRRHTACGAE